MVESLRDRLLVVGKQHPEAFLKAATYSQELMLSAVSDPDTQENVNVLMDYVLAGVLTDIGVKL